MAQLVHRDQARRFLYGLGTLAALVAIGVIGAIVQAGGPIPAKKYTYVTATFSDVGVLKTGKPVRTGGVRIGTVTDIAYRDGNAAATLRLDGHHEVYADASAQMGNISALGKKYVNLDPGTAAAGPLGPEGIGLAQTTASTSLEDVLAALDPKTRKQLQRTLVEVGTGLNGHGDDVNVALARSPQLIGDLRTVAMAMTTPEAELTGLLLSADRLVGRFEGREQEIRRLLRNAEVTVSALGVDGGMPLEQAVTELPSTLHEATVALDVLHAPLQDAHDALAVLRPGAEALGQATPDLRAFLRDSTPTLGKVPPIAKQLRPAVTDLTELVTDARPLVRPVRGAASSLRELLVPLAPYTPDVGRFFSQHDLLSGTLGSDDQHYFAAMLTGPGLFSVAGLPDPVYNPEYYPLPGGVAWNHRTVTDARK